MPDNNILISFSESIARALLKEDLELQVDGPREGGYDFTWELVENEDGTYEIVIDFADDDIPEGTNFRVDLTAPDLSDVDKSQVTETDLELN